jgi:predicted 3-demethylubiquinone-9 3-methyltransferase (glyoxalase superfamily)
MASMQKITPNLWFDNQAEEAATFYVSIFKDSKLGRISRYGKEGYEIHKRPADSILTIEFELLGQKFMALNGGPVFKFNEAISFIVYCNNQEEVDYYWEKLKEGGDPNAQQCGWLKDKFGVSWQVIPSQLNDMMADHDPQKTERVMKVMLKMKKLDLAELQRAYAGK